VAGRGDGERLGDQCPEKKKRPLWDPLWKAGRPRAVEPDARVAREVSAEEDRESKKKDEGGFFVRCRIRDLQPDRCGRGEERSGQRVDPICRERWCRSAYKESRRFGG